MRTAKVVESVDIEASRADVFDIVVSFKRRLQLSPLWGVAEVKEVAPEFPQEGSYYHSKLVESDEAYDTIVTTYEPTHKFAYRLTNRRQSQAIWTLQDLPLGTRLIYHEEFLVDEAGEDEFVRSVRNVVTEWLNNTKRYAELSNNWWGGLARWGVDRFVLPLKVPQRRVILILLAWEAVGCLSFIALGLGWWAARLLGWM